MNGSERKIEIILFLVLFLSFAYFYQGGGANQNARLDQIRSVVELGQLNLKPFSSSHDIVHVAGKTYPNKAPGVSLMGLAPYYLISRLKPLVIRSFSEDFYHLFSCYLTTVAVIAFISALGGVVFFRLLGLFHQGLFPRLTTVFALFLGTPMFAYSTVLYGHAVSSVFALTSFYLLYRYLVKEPETQSNVYIFLAGLAGGWTAVTEYPPALIVLALSLFCLIASPLRWGRRAKYLGFFILGLAIPAAVMFGYNRLVFGNPLFIAYFDKTAAAHAAYKRGPVLGFSLRQREMVKALYQTSFGPFRGLLHISPFLVLIFPGSIYLLRKKGRRALFFCLWSLCLVYFFLNVIYPYWYGGKALGPRHAMEMLPWLVLLAFGFVVRFPRLALLLAGVSIFLNLTAVAVRPEEYVTRPFHDLYLSAFFNGSLAINHETTFQVNKMISAEFNAFNLGMVAGLKGQASLYPLYLLWLLGGAALCWLGRRKRDPSLPPPSPAPPWAKFLAVLLAILIAIGVVILIRQAEHTRSLRELEGAGEFRVPPEEAPAPHVHIRTAPGHRLQVWEVTAAFSAGDTLKVKAQHAAAGESGGFYLVAYADTMGDGRPDTEFSRSPFLTAVRGGEWSQWTFTAPQGKVFVGNTWNEGAMVYFDRIGWPHRDFSSAMFFSRQGPPTGTTSPRSTNMAVEVIRGE